LKNDRRIEYDHLVIGAGMKHAPEAIEGFDEAWKEFDHPVYANKDHPQWPMKDHKYTRWHYNYTGGDAIFTIPTYPFAGEVESYNFLLSADIWKMFAKNGKLSPINSFTIVNANESFCQHSPSTDSFFKDACANNGIKIELGQNLTAINKENQTATFTNVKTGETSTRDYHNLHACLPCKPHQELIDAGLTDPTYGNLLDVDRETLKHKKYDNIFGVGDVCNVPTTKSFWAGFYQIAVVRNNLARSLKG